MDWIISIQKAIDYVEEHILEEINYEKVAKYAYSSSFHFQRIFTAVCGFTLGEYVRNRRLSLAGEELAKGESKVLDIALKYGYDTHESFSRAFSRFHGVSPSQAKNGALIKSYSRLSVKLILSGGTTLNYRIEKKESFDLVVRKKSFPKNQELKEVEIAQFWGECFSNGTVNEIIKYANDKIFGKSIVGASFETETTEDDFPYAIGASYNGETIIEEHLSVVRIPAHTYIAFKCAGRMPEAFKDTCRQICNEFFPTSEYQPCGLDFEVYPPIDEHNSNYSCEIWVAVEKRI